MSKLRIGFVLTGSFCTFSNKHSSSAATRSRRFCPTAPVHSTPALAQPRTGARS